MIERNVKMFLDQDYENKVMIIYNNSDVPQVLDESLIGKNIILINQHLDSRTGEPYTNLGAIYNDAIKHIPEDVVLLNMADDDDIFLPNHISEGVHGYQRAKALNPNCKAYKPQFSYYNHAGGVAKMCNVMEPSIFVEVSHIKEYGFHDNTINQHHKWLDGLGSNILTDPEGISTLVYDWNTVVPVWKTSGDPQNPENFNNYTKNSQDHGDRIITPIENCEIYYDLTLNK